jgi:hypothetical protein
VLLVRTGETADIGIEDLIGFGFGGLRFSKNFGCLTVIADKLFYYLLIYYNNSIHFLFFLKRLMT